ncbi:hypothetical protein K435DRAFT_625306, partial [Dendrothele bispora CBS 962.96]
YSQGGRLVHNSAKLLSADDIYVYVILYSRVISTMAKPSTGVSPDNTKVICHNGDNICAHGDLILPPHLS